ncbi:OLC1v1011858C3 [Oldenlandia corymbosa var. corymbosa]|uniref:OLC1v1011858C3 n=1 Tax=Oldenlandia corymbosa var. corymbosa TaxID=529605 RepID=A0AAV1DUM1_OLDCO|nr:OLC1v1011858C3 [Oldenlandia corymbosa var. corymbosa]
MLMFPQLLGWMHRKLRHTGREQSTTFTENPASYSARTLLDEQLFPAESTYGFTRPIQSNKKCSELLNITKEIGDEIHEKDSHDEFFHGFLAIGTFGSESIDKYPPTPTFSMSFQNSNDKMINIIEDEVMLINKEIEKFLSDEAKEVNDESSGRSSQVTIVSYSNEQMKDGNTDERYSANYPLQKYLIGDSIELPVADIGSKKEKMSLEEFFSMSDRNPENSVNKCNSPDKQQKKGYATRFVKNILKRAHSTAMSCTTGSTDCNEQATKPRAIKKKFPKVLNPKFFHGKVHPEEMIPQKQLTMSKKEKITKVSGKANISNAEEREKKRPTEIGSIKKEIFNSTPDSQMINSQGTMLNKERWIKTEVDYLVLEL